MKKKSLLVVLGSIIVLIILCIFFINRTNSYNYIYKNVSLEEDTSIFPKLKFLDLGLVQVKKTSPIPA